MTQAISTIPARIPMPVNTGIDEGKWRVLVESIFPSAKSAGAIMLAVDYCKARNLDILKKPVNIVPMWSKEKSAYVETVWPSINEIQITASRTHAWGGMDEAKWGPEKTREFKGVTKGEIGETKKSITYPESCSVTVYRIVEGQKCAFTETVFWEEAYARIGKTELPNDMWEKRPRGQLHKCAKAASLRAAFPEEGSYTAEEMEGKVIEDVEGIQVDAHAANTATTGELTAKSAYGSTKLMKEKFKEICTAINDCKTEDDLNDIFERFREDFKLLQQIDQQIYDNLLQLGRNRRAALEAPAEPLKNELDERMEAFAEPPAFLKQGA